MTIKVEREALLRLLSRQPSTPQLDVPINRESEFVVVDIEKQWCNEECPVGRLRDSSYDDESVYTVSTASLSSDSEDEDEERRVSFAEPLVTQMWTRPYTPRDEISNLFYSTEETQRFRHEYRLERKLLTELAIDPDSFPVDSEELSNLLTSTNQPSARHRISRVVVLHNDKLETFFNTDETITCSKMDVPSGDDFFDSDSFWSGSITWY